MPIPTQQWTLSFQLQLCTHTVQSPSREHSSHIPDKLCCHAPVSHVTSPSVSQVSVGSYFVYLNSEYQCLQVTHCNGSLSRTVSKQLCIITLLWPLYYLWAQLQHDLAGVVAGFTSTGVNYGHSVALSWQRYGQHTQASHHLYNALVEMYSHANLLSALQLWLMHKVLLTWTVTRVVWSIGSANYTK